MELTSKTKIYWHADDYGMTERSDARIEECRTHGCLNSVSIVPNGDLSRAMTRLKDSGLHLALHLNLVEGCALSPAAQIPLLVSPDGHFCCSFGGLLKHSLSPHRAAFQKQIYQEIEAQLLAYLEALPPNTPLRIDSHQHVHMIPLIFHTLLQVIRDHHLVVEHLRIPAEPLGPFLSAVELYPTYAPLNVVKQLVLNFCWLLDRPEFQNSGISTALFCGILFSGQMDTRRVARVLPAYERLAERRGQKIELLFHPGGVRPGEPLFDPQKTAFHPFYLSPGREIEAQTLHANLREAPDDGRF